MALFLQVCLVCCHKSVSQNPYILLAAFQMLCRVTLPLHVILLRETTEEYVATGEGAEEATVE